MKPRVHSFDAWDTLIARRSIKDVYNEENNLFPIQENVSKVSSSDIIVSDYYDTNLLVKAIPTITGLHNKVFCTNTGKRDGSMWEQLKKEYIILSHTGDNTVTDVTMPFKAGIQANLVNISGLSSVESRLSTLGFPNLAKAVREARLVTYNQQYRQLELAQIEVNFPILVLASYLVHTQAINQYDNILMSSRDCFLWAKLQEKICKKLHGEYKVHYFYTSRIARTVSSTSYLHYLDNLLTSRSVVIDLCGYGRTLPLLLNASKYPDTDILLLSKYNDPGRMSRAQALVSGPNIKKVDSLIERPNLARHPMVVDVVNGLPVYGNPAKIPWETLPEIEVMHSAFAKAMEVMDNYDVMDDLKKANTGDIESTIEYLFGQILEYKSALQFRNDIMATEEQPILKQLKSITPRVVPLTTHKTTYVTRLHCESPYFSQIAIGDGLTNHIVEKIRDNSRIMVGSNSAKMANDLKVMFGNGIYLPSAYHLTPKLSLKPPHPTIDNVACLGRPITIKNILTQAVAAIRFAQFRGKKLRFHVNQAVDHDGKLILDTIRALFQRNQNIDLIVHEWMPKDQLYEMLSSMDVGMQVSLSEASNVMSIDMVNVGIPIVVSPEIKWACQESIAHPTDSDDIFQKLIYATRNPDLVDRNRKQIELHNKICVEHWNRFLGNGARVLFLYYTAPTGVETGISSVAKYDAEILRVNGINAAATNTNFSYESVMNIMGSKHYSHVIFEASYAPIEYIK